MISINVFGETRNMNIVEKALKCPHCQSIIIPHFIVCAYHAQYCYAVFCKCTNCGKPFISIYKTDYKTDPNTLYYKEILPPPSVKLEFPEEIAKISPAYTQIYNEAYVAEQMRLNQICGVGYRKALEFLIKDYLVQLDPDQEEVIKKMALGKCISDKVSNENVKDVAQRATWLGNDETHYIRTWEDKDVYDLKELIEITSLWIDMELKTKKILFNMPTKVPVQH